MRMKFALLLAAVAIPSASLAAKEAGADLVIRDVTVVDPESGKVTAHRDVFIDEDRIVAVAQSGADKRGADQTIDGSGKFVMPGLMDMHSHTNYRPIHIASLKLMTANGVTGIREMGSDCMEPEGFAMCLGEMREAQQKIEAGEMVGPRILELSTLKIDSNRREGAEGAALLYRPIDSDSARATVAGLQERGPDILKVGGEFLPDAFVAFAAEAKARGVKFGGHIPAMYSVADVARMGMTSIEHARDLPTDCSAAGEPYRKAVMAKIRGEAESWPDRRALPGASRDTFDETICAAQIAAMVENGTYYVPTHLTREMDFRAGEAEYRNDPRMVYLTQMQQRFWGGDLDRTAKMPPEMVDDLRDFFALGLRTTGMAHDAGVKIMVGTDANDTMVFPGFSLHDELGHLVAAGLTPMEALRAATSVPAEYLGRTEDFGGVSEGKLADLVLLSADPTADIANSRAILAVIQGGHVRDRAELDDMLSQVKAWVVMADAQAAAAKAAEE